MILPYTSSQVRIGGLSSQSCTMPHCTTSMLSFLHCCSVGRTTLKVNLSPLHLACSAGHFSAAKLLVEQGCAVESCDSDGLTPYEHAISNGFPEISKWIQGNRLRIDSLEKEDEIATEDGRMEPSSSADMKHVSDDLNRHLMKLAFSIFCLKDKIVFNYLANEEMKSTSRCENNQGNFPAQTENLSVERPHVSKNPSTFATSLAKAILTVLMWQCLY